MTATLTTADARAEFLNRLDRFRRRLAFIAMIRRALVAALLALGATMATATLRGTSLGTAVLTAMAAVAAAVVVGAFVAWRRTPTLANVASVLDRELRSNDCFVTAVECANAADVVSTLVVREAARRLAPVTPTDLLPFQWPRRFGTLTAAVSAIVVGAVLIQSRFSVDDGNAQASAARSDPSPDRATPANPQRGRTSNPNASTARAAAPQTADVRGASTRPVGAALAPPRAPAPPSALGPSTSARSELALPSANRAEPAPAREPAPAGADRRAQDRTADRNGANSGGRAAGGGNAGADSGAGGSAGLASRLTAGAGGVNGANGSLATARRNATPPPSAPYNVRYEAAWKDAQAAIARERIPADLRQLVKDYFTAIRPPQP